MLDSAPVDAAAAGGAATTERVVVTGSYIPTAETESALPVTVYTAEVLKKQGANTPVEGLRQLPSFVGNALTENDSNGGNGAALINLRALGCGEYVGPSQRPPRVRIHQHQRHPDRRAVADGNPEGRCFGCLRF